MKIVIAPDKFKNSLTGLQFCNAVEEGFKQSHSNFNIVKLPLADGGDGTIEVVNYYLKGNEITLIVNNPFFKPVTATYLYAETSKTAFIEMAEASGVKLLDAKDFDCKNATTLGTGEMIVDAITKGAKTIILGIGGSATNDCGIGMAKALGYKFLDVNQNEVSPIGSCLSDIVSIDKSEVHPKLHTVSFKIACDVNNPLHGNNGSAYVYGSQKGATQEDIKMLDKGLQDFAKVLKTTFNIDPQKVPGAGAAGGVGIASKLFLNGILETGNQLIKELADFDEKIKDTDWIITGEGQLDQQTFSGKTIQGVMQSSEEKNIKVAAFCGAISLDEKTIKNFGIAYSDAVLNYATNLEDAMKNSDKYVTEMAKNFVKTL